MVMIQSGIRNGLDLLHDRYHRLLKGLSMTVLHNEADAEDLIQDVFVEIWARSNSYDCLKGKPLAWIATLTRRRSIDRLRKRDTYLRAAERFSREYQPMETGWTHVHEEVGLSEVVQHVRRALQALPEPQRAAIRLAFNEQMTQREIAEHTGIPLGTIKTRLELGLKKMAGKLSFEKEFRRP